MSVQSGQEPVEEADEGSRVVGDHFCRELIEGGIVSRKPVTRHAVGLALKPDQTVKVEEHRGAGKMHPKNNSLFECAAGAVLFQVCYAALHTVCHIHELSSSPLFHATENP